MRMRAAALLLAALAVLPAAPVPTRLLRIPVRVDPGADRPDPKSFRVTLDRKETRVTRVLTPEDGQLLLIVLDMVGDLGAVDPAKAALIAEMEKLPASTYAGVLRAQDGLTVLADPTGDRKVVTDAIRDLTISGRPGLLDALDTVERMADTIARKAQVRVAVLYVTDSDVGDYREDFTNPVINSSDPHDLSRKFPETLIQEKMSKMQGLFAGYQTPLHIVHLSYQGDRLNEAYRNGLERLAADMAGSSVFCRSRGEIEEAIRNAFRNIAAEYALILQAPERVPETMQVQISAGDAPLVYRTRVKFKEK